MYLFVDTKGSFVSKHQGRLRVSKDRERLQEVPLMHLQQVIISGGGVGISSDAVRACAEEGIPIHFVGQSDRPQASLYSAGLTGTVLTRRAQLRAYDRPEGVALARAFTQGKLQNQANLLRYIAKYRKEANPELFQALTQAAAEVVDSLQAARDLPAATVDELREPLMGVEGRYMPRATGERSLRSSQASWAGPAAKRAARAIPSTRR